MMKLNAGLITLLPASDSGSTAVWGSKRINPRLQSCLCLTWSGYPSNDDDDISLVRESRSKYFGHFVSKKVSANAIANGIFDFLSANHKEKNNIIGIVCDGTAVNTGAKGGAIRMIELKLNKPVSWSICQLNANKSPLHHLFQNLDGKTTGPKD